VGRRPGAANPGELLSGDTTPMTREQALALAVDLSRRSTPADGGFCTFQPVVDGSACPCKLDCHNCDKFVLSGADLLYWRRKREQWASIAERAPDDATADYLHQVFEPTARAIDGLEKAWPASACSTRRWRWTCADRRTASTSTPTLERWLARLPLVSPTSGWATRPMRRTSGRPAGGGGRPTPRRP